MMRYCHARFAAAALGALLVRYGNEGYEGCAMEAAKNADAMMEQRKARM